ELDRPDRRQGQAVDGEIKDRVHGGEDDAEGDRQAKLPAAEPRPPPGPTPEREDHRRAGDTQPGNAERRNLREEQHGERGAEIVKDRADEKEEVRRQPIEDGGTGERSADWRCGRVHGGRCCAALRLLYMPGWRRIAESSFDLERESADEL